jgi:L-rhamnose mutarotase|tara:strand:+ start:209 stop:451 length:243 start_codon:yes stop_codon:yes gene_type:complete
MNKKDIEYKKKHIIYSWASDFLDSLDFVDYTIYKLSTSKDDRMTLFDLDSDRTLSAEEYEDISNKIFDEFCEIISKEVNS